MTASHVSISGLGKRFGEYQALEGIDVAIGKGEILALLGPSGCGKTTLLRCLAGLEQPDQGRIEIGRRTVFDAARRVSETPERRRIGLVFQSYALWPHLTVAQNVAYGLKVKKVERSEAAGRVEAILATVGLTGLADRLPSMLSGGQQQRVALARSLVVEAEVILFDEPLSNLDLKLREEMRFELRRLITRLGVTAVFVTHDQSEAMVLADRVCLMRAGRLVQAGTPRGVYEQPRTRFAMDFFGSSNFLEVERMEGDQAVLGGLGCLHVPAGVSAGSVIGIRPEHIELLTAPPDGPNLVGGTIVESAFLGTTTIYDVEVGTRRLQVFSMDPDHGTGDKVTLRLPTKRLVPLAE